MTVLFDFFGTLVDYSPSRTEQGYPWSTTVLESLGCRLGHDEWLSRWSACSERLYAESVASGYRKPRPEIFTAALGAVGAAAVDAVFVGDSYDPDFVGPTRMGMRAYLIVGDGRDAPPEVPASRRVRTVLDLTTRLDR